MANLLTKETQKNIAHRRRERKIIVVSGLVTLWLLTGLIFNLSLWFNLGAQRKILAANSSMLPAPAHNLAAINRLKDQITQLRGWGLDQVWSDHLLYLQSARPNSIKINQVVGLKTDNGATVRLALAGESASRQELVAFVDRLKREGVFKQVDLPVDYLLESANHQFIINLELVGRL